MTISIKAPVTVLAAALSLSACGHLLDVNNPNNLVESSIESPAAAAAVVNGSQALVTEAVGNIWAPYEVATDEFTWIGSRDAWGSLDNGFVSDPSNEFTDAAYPSIAQARWMADKAVSILEGHVSDGTPGAPALLAKAHLYAGIIYMVVGEVQQDFTISDKREAGPPIGPDQMYTMLDQAITHLDAAISGGDADIKMEAMAVRARAKASRAIWDKIKPSPNTGDPLVKSASAAADAQAAIDMAGGATADWNFNVHYSASTVGNDFAFESNSRKEHQVDTHLVNLDAANDIVSIAIDDPIDGGADPAFQKRLEIFKNGAFDSQGDRYSPNTLASTRLLHLIIAEDALANSDMTKFAQEINYVREMDGLSDYTNQMPAMDMLKYERQVNTWGMGLRLSDMYRFGIQDALWSDVSDAYKAPGTLLPITLVEVRANCYLNGLGC